MLAEDPRTSVFRARTRIRFRGMHACPNSEQLLNALAKRLLRRHASETSGNSRSKWCSRRCSSKQVATAIRRSAFAWAPHLRVKRHTSSGCCRMCSETSIIACHRGSSSPSGAALPGSTRSALRIAWTTLMLSANARSHWRPASELQYANRAPSGRPVQSACYALLVQEWGGQA